MLLVIDGRMKRGCLKIWYPKIYWLMIIFPKKNNGWGRHPFSDSSITRCHQVFLQPSQLPCAVAQAEAGLQPLQRPQWPWPEFVEIIG